MRFRTFFSGLIFCFASFSLQAGWNEQFEEKTNCLIEQIAELQQAAYCNSYQNFLKVRESILENDKVQKKMSRILLGDKLTLLDVSDEVVFKKRRNDHIHELFAWEVACLLGVSDYMLPSFPIEIGGKKAILQQKEKFVFGKGKITTLPLSVVNTVSQETYWKAHLCAYLLGIADLVAKNIGVADQGKILFFDAEVCFSYCNTPMRSKSGFSTGFIAESFEWPQYTQPLEANVASSLREFVASLDHIEETLKAYEEFRGLPILNNDFTHRLEKVRNFPFQEGQTFKDFFISTHPRLGPGLDKLARLVGKIMQKKVGHGSTLIFMSRKIHQYSLSAQQKQSIEKWLNTYVD